MIYRTYAQKDSTIYEPSVRINQNTGADEILEVTKFFESETDSNNFIGNSRILIKFDMTDISESIANETISGSDIKYYLNLTSTEQSEVQSEYDLEVFQLAESWDEGIGQFYYNPYVTNGVSWQRRTDSSLWDTGSTIVDVTASYYKSDGGGVWYTASSVNTTASQTFNKYTNDLRVNVTDYVNDWLVGNRDNNGFIIKRTNTDETGSVRFGSSKFFSNETHTIYVPTIEVQWDNSSFETGSLSTVNDTDLILYPKNLKSHYKENSKDRIRVVGRERFRERTFSTSSLYTTLKHLPESTYYQLRDVETNLVIIPFDDIYTKVSCDESGNYFDFWFNTLQSERFYQFEFKVVRSAREEYFDGYVFKLIR
jgi:hypothetical protein